MTPGRRIAEAASILGDDELELLAVIAERLAEGRRRYGELRPASDRRDFAHEALEEVADALVYAAAGLVRERRRSLETTRGARP